MKRANTIYISLFPATTRKRFCISRQRFFLDKLDRLIQAGTISDKSKILFINDGSKDSTWQIIYELTRQNSKYAGLSFSRNYGHQSAILAGMMAARSKADAVVTIDADLQQDIEALDQFLECYQNGCEIVYGVRNDRDTDGFFKRRQQDCLQADACAWLSDDYEPCGLSPDVKEGIGCTVRIS